MNNCELCKFPARMYCESDEASLCWDCDAKVHGANFLVARHMRSLLCNSCQSPTPWKASGAKLGPTVSVCQRCADGGGEEEVSEGEGGNDDEIIHDSDDDDEEEEEEGEEACVDDDEDGDIQVVPWSSTTPPPPPASASSSSCEDSSSCDADGDVYESETVFSLKRMRKNASDRRSPNDLGCSSSQRSYGSASAAMAAATRVDGEATRGVDSSTRPLKRGRKTEPGQYGPKSPAIMESLKRFYDRDISSGNNASDSSEETRAVD